MNRSGIKAFFAPLRWVIIAGIIFFISSGEINNFRVWIYFAVYGTGGMLMSLILLKKSPQLLNDRGEVKKGTKKIDLITMITYGLFAGFITPCIAGLDYRFELSDMNNNYYLIGIWLYIVSAIFVAWPMLYNPYFEGTIRIQNEKGHKVIDSGPYRIVRHPGYLGMLIGSLSFPFAFNSWISFIPVGIMIILVFIRTNFEDKILIKELEGYKNYTDKVKYRIIPYLW